MSKLRRHTHSTEKVELIETHNIALSIKRIRDVSSNIWEDGAWRHALYHGLAMTAIRTETLGKIRIALELP